MSEDPYAHLAKVRLLQCRTCKTIEELEDFQGRPEDDTILNVATERHHDHVGAMFTVPIALWLDDRVRQSIIAQVSEGSKGLAEIVPDHYEVRNTFLEDAMKCYKAHNRPKEGCSDWHKSSKELLPNTRAERKAEGLPLRPTGPRRYVCDYCPVRSYYQSKIYQETIK